jgi:hypothetical protein
MSFLRGEDNGRSHPMELQGNRSEKAKLEMEKLQQYLKEKELYNGILATKCQQVKKWMRMIPEPKKKGNIRNENLMKLKNKK